MTASPCAKFKVPSTVTIWLIAIDMLAKEPTDIVDPAPMRKAPAVIAAPVDTLTPEALERPNTAAVSGLKIPSTFTVPAPTRVVPLSCRDAPAPTWTLPSIVEVAALSRSDPPERFSVAWGPILRLRAASFTAEACVIVPTTLLGMIAMSVAVGTVFVSQFAFASQSPPPERFQVIVAGTQRLSRLSANGLRATRRRMSWSRAGRAGSTAPNRRRRRIGGFHEGFGSVGDRGGGKRAAGAARIGSGRSSWVTASCHAPVTARRAAL